MNNVVQCRYLIYQYIYKSLRKNGVLIQQSGSPILNKEDIINPTIKNLESICGFSNTKELLESKNAINPYDIATIEPKFFMENGKMVGLMPGDEGYEDH